MNNKNIEYTSAEQKDNSIKGTDEVSEGGVNIIKLVSIALVIILLVYGCFFSKNKNIVKLKTELKTAMTVPNKKQKIQLDDKDIDEDEQTISKNSEEETKNEDAESEPQDEQAQEQIQEQTQERPQEQTQNQPQKQKSLKMPVRYREGSDWESNRYEEVNAVTIKPTHIEYYKLNSDGNPKPCEETEEADGIILTVYYSNGFNHPVYNVGFDEFNCYDTNKNLFLHKENFRIDLDALAAHEYCEFNTIITKEELEFMPYELDNIFSKCKSNYSW